MDLIGLAENWKIAAHVQRRRRCSRSPAGSAVLAGSALQMARKAEAVHFARHDDIGENQIDAVALDLAQRRFGIRNPANGVAELLEQAGAGRGDIRIVLDQQTVPLPPASAPSMLSTGAGATSFARQQDGDVVPLPSSLATLTVPPA